MRSDPRQRLLSRLAPAWTAFGDSWAGLSDAELDEPGVTGDWSVKDILAHVTTWEEEALACLPVILAGGRPPRYAQVGGIDAFNARKTEENRRRSLAEVRRRLDDTHRRLLALVEAAPDAELGSETRFRRRLRLDTYAHYPGHTEAIRRWRSRRRGD